MNPTSPERRAEQRREALRHGIDLSELHHAVYGDPFDPKFDVATPTPETIREFVSTLGPAFAEARAYTPAAETLRTYGSAYLTEAEVAAVRRYGTAAERSAVADR